MIRSLTGTVLAVYENAVVLDVHGVGYLVNTPLSSLPEEHETITLHTYLAVRETALDLYGFQDVSDLSMFELLLGVPKVGPKSALQILNQATPQLLVEAAEKNDAGYLHKLSGIGKKTCENVIQYLHGKLDHLPHVTNSQSDLTTVQADAIDALVSLGYDAATARETILGFDSEDATINSLVTQALKRIT